MSIPISIITAGLERDGRVIVVFSGRSMLPTLRNGMRLLVEKIPPENIRPCDIIMYRKNGGIVAHRVIKIISGTRGASVFVTRGDNHAYIDCSYIPREDLMGIVRSAFNKDNPAEDILIKSRLTGLLYAASGSMVLAVRGRRESVPVVLRAVFKYFVGGFFFICKKFIHALQTGIYHVRLFSARRAAAS